MIASTVLYAKALQGPCQDDDNHPPNTGFGAAGPSTHQRLLSLFFAEDYDT